MGQCIAKNVGLPLKYGEMVNAVTACPAWSEQYLRELPMEFGAIHQNSQPVKNWQIGYIGPLFLNKGSKNDFACMDTESGLTQACPLDVQTRLPPLGN